MRIYTEDRLCSMNALSPFEIAIADVNYGNAGGMCEIWRELNNGGGFNQGFYDFHRIGLKYQSVVRDYLITRN